MSIPFKLLNCFWLIVPLLAWNLLLGPHLTDVRITSDRRSPKGLLITENLTRILVFSLPVCLPLQWQTRGSIAGLAIYLTGTVLYFASWLPLLLAPRSAWSNRATGLLAPRLTPYLPFLGIALIGQSWPYGLISAMFILLHTTHGIQNLSAPKTREASTEPG